MKDLLLRRACVNTSENIIVIDWRLPANSTYYFQSVANTQVVGRMIACVINRLKAGLNLNTDMVYLIGHSLGAHVVGFAGKGVTPRCWQIQADDPAGPAYQEFDNISSSAQLQATDAKCVLSIHSNGYKVFPGLEG